MTHRTPIAHVNWSQTSMAFTEEFAGEMREVCYLNIKAMLEKEAEGDLINAMWTGYESAFIIYGLQICLDYYLKRGLSDQWQFKIHNVVNEHRGVDFDFNFASPPWREDQDLMRSHRSFLVRQNPKHYRKQFGAKTPDNIPFIWPIIDEDSYYLGITKEDKKRVDRKVLTIPAGIREWVSVL